MEAMCSSDTSVDFQRNTLGYIPEDSTPHNHRCESLTSYYQQLLEGKKKLQQKIAWT
jgi:hypothetical protein